MVVSTEFGILFGVFIGFLLQIWLVFYLVRERYKSMEKRLVKNVQNFLSKYDALEEELKKLKGEHK